MKPTAEQDKANDLFKTGNGLAIEAGAGCGKTTVLKMLAEGTKKRGQYVAFNKAIVEEAARKMPANVKASTMHSLAYRAKGHAFRARLNAKRMPSSELARILGVEGMTVQKFDGASKFLAPAYLASLAMRGITNFCNSDNPAPAHWHVPYIEGLDPIAPSGKRGYAVNGEVSRHLVPIMTKAWADLMNPNGSLPFQHDHYLKAWELDSPNMGAEVVFFDEGQDASPVMASIVFQQKSSQIVVVGDSQQAIYGWRGAVDAIEKFRASGCEHATLSQSFRFGQAVADVANMCLSQIESAELRLVGTPSIESRVEPVAGPDAILCRTNANAVRELMRFQTAGKKAALMGGGKEMLAFARAARELQAGRWTSHADLAMFDTWAAVQDYVENDPAGDELALSVRLIEEFGTDNIVAALEGQPSEEQCELIVSTAHRAKGREWPSVRLADDFPDPEKREISDEEWRLAYVAATRAQQVLDPFACKPIAALLQEAGA